MAIERRRALGVGGRGIIAMKGRKEGKMEGEQGDGKILILICFFLPMKSITMDSLKIFLVYRNKSEKKSN